MQSSKHILHNLLLAFATSLALGWSPSLLCGQTTGTGTITGTVVDATQSVVPGVKITATQTDTGRSRTVLTNRSGNYTLPQMPIGNYEIKAESTGFQTFNQQGLSLSADTTLPVNIQLQVGASTESVTVTSAPPPLKTESGDISTLISGQQLRELALNGRNFTQFLTLGTGVTSTQVGRRMGVGQEGNPLLSVNGGRLNSTQYTYDGILAMDTGGNRGVNLFPPMEALEEIQVHKSNYSADSGSYGYGQVNIVTKSGGLQYHGSLYETFGNQVLDARNFFANTVSPFKQNIFGYTIGGPVFPNRKSRWHEKVFFFWSEGWNKRRGPQLVSYTAPPSATFTAQTPDAVFRSGDFSGIATPLLNPSTRRPFPRNVIPVSSIDPNATILLNTYYPLPNRPGAPNFAFTSNSGSDWREELGRVDLNFTSNTSLMVRYAHDSWTQDQNFNFPGPTAFPTIPGVFIKPGQNLVLRLTNILSPTTLNQVTFGFSMNRLQHLLTPASVRPQGLNIPTVFGANGENIIPTINIAGYGSIGTQQQINANPVYTYRDDFSHQAGNHSLKAGLLVYHILKFDTTQITGQQGVFNFNGSATGNGLADFLLGNAFQYNENTPIPPEYFFSEDYEMYVQDDWKVRPNLTLNFGIRDEIFKGAPFGDDKFNRISIFVPGLYDPAAAPTVLPNGRLLPGSGDSLNGIITPTMQKRLDLPRSLLRTRNNAGPRFGFAWSPGKNAKTVLRGGYGIFYHWDNSNRELLRGNPPFTQSASIFNTSLADPTQGTFALFPPPIQGMDPKYLSPMVQQWSFNVQRNLGWNTVLSVAYVGNHAVHLDQGININQLRPGQANGVNVNTVRRYVGYGNINYDERSASANYNGLQIDARRRVAGGLGLEVAYTWSKALQFQAGQDEILQKSEKGLAGLDRTQVVTINYVYDLPFFKNAGGFVGTAFGGWEVTGITTFQSGLPNTVTIPGDRAQVGGGAQRPDRVAPLEIHARNVDNYFNTSAFALGPIGRFGNSGVNILRGPGIANFDFNLRKNFRFPVTADRTADLQFSAEAYNIFNHPNFVGLGTVFNTPTFGRLTGALDPRNMDFKLRLTF